MSKLTETMSLLYDRYGCDQGAYNGVLHQTEVVAHELAHGVVLGEILGDRALSAQVSTAHEVM